jgi:hypothetical protein
MGEKNSQDKNEQTRKAMQSQENAGTQKPNKSEAFNKTEKGVGSGIYGQIEQVTEKLVTGIFQMLNPILLFSRLGDIANDFMAHPLYTADRFAELTELNFRRFGK